MIAPSHLNTQHPLQIFTSKSPLFSTSSSMKIKTIIHTLIVSHVRPVVRALSKAKTFLVEVLRENQLVHLICSTRSSKKKHRNMKIFLGSFRLHYNWCSSHVMPVPAEPVLQGISGPHLHCDSNWNSMVTGDRYQQYNEENPESLLSGYLHWIEEKVQEKGNGEDQGKYNEIDQLADLFIKTCHEKFILEKQESYRRFQDMMARSI